MSIDFSRREMMLSASACLAGSVLAQRGEAAESSKDQKSPFTFCFNTSTIRGQELDIVQEIDIAGKAGYDGVEPWMRKIDAYVDGGGSLKDLGKRIKDHGMTVDSAIGFAQWIVDDDAKRAAGLETAKRDMDRLAQIGGTRIAAPPTGATRQTDLDLFKAAERYRALLELGKKMGVTPQVEVWGFSKSLSRLGETVFVAVESGHPDACILPDVYHIFKGGSDFAGLELLSGQSIQCFHINDYPANPPRAEMNDSHRVYPGDGVAPLNKVLRTLRDNGCQCALSLELFNRDYWKQDALEVAKTGLNKTKAAVAKAMA
ncbi:MAG: xylose isomerase [Planctomycetaceae bacterium]|nr:xylose isomerase [Planctomycetaceae bacterium]